MRHDDTASGPGASIECAAFRISAQGTSFADGSHISHEGAVTGPLAEAMAGQIQATVDAMRAPSPTSGPPLSLLVSLDGHHISAAPTLKPNFVLGELVIRPDGVTYKGETVNDAGDVHRALTEVLSGRVALAPGLSPIQGSKSHPFHRDLAGLNEFINGYCNGDSRMIACAEAAWYRCMERNGAA